MSGVEPIGAVAPRRERCLQIVTEKILSFELNTVQSESH